MNEALLSNETRTTNDSKSQAEEHSSNKATGDDMDSAAVTKRLEDELKKRDALIEVLDCTNFCLKYFLQPSPEGIRLEIFRILWL